jgi:hypothetical protein
MLQKANGILCFWIEKKYATVILAALSIVRGYPCCVRSYSLSFSGQGLS